MTRRTIIATAAGAVVLLGSAGAAVAAGTSSSSGSTTTAAKAAHTHHAHAFRGEYAQWTTYDATTKADVVHDGIKGTVSAVSPTSITVKAKDGKDETFSVASATKVSVKGDAKGTTATIGQVKVGDRVVVEGTGASDFAATHVHDRGVAIAATAPKS